LGTLGCQSKTISCQPAERYGRRFQEFVRSHMSSSQAMAPGQNAESTPRRARLAGHNSFTALDARGL
jgi:hypothetical protein